MAIQANVVFAYVKLQSPVKSLNEGDTEFTVDCVMSKADAKAWNKEHPKNKYKSFDNDDFLTKFKFDEVPFDDQDEQFVVKFKKACSKKGIELPVKFRPRVFELVDGKPVDVTFSKLVANQSTGKVSFSQFSNSYGEFVQLDAILVEKMIEYQGAGGGVGSDFGAVVLAEAPENQKVVQKQGEVAEKEVVKPKKPNKPVQQDDSDESPF